MKPLCLIALLALTGCGLGSSTARWWRSTHPPKATPEQVQFMREQAAAEMRWRATNGYPKFYTNAQGRIDRVEWDGGDFYRTNHLKFPDALFYWTNLGMVHIAYYETMLFGKPVEPPHVSVMQYSATMATGLLGWKPLDMFTNAAPGQEYSKPYNAITNWTLPAAPRTNAAYPARSVFRVAQIARGVSIVTMARTNHPPWNTNWVPQMTDQFVKFAWSPDFQPQGDHQYYGLEVLTNEADIAQWERNPRAPALPWTLIASNITCFSWDLAGQHSMTITASYGWRALFRPVAREGGWP